MKVEAPASLTKQPPLVALTAAKRAPLLSGTTGEEGATVLLQGFLPLRAWSAHLLLHTAVYVVVKAMLSAAHGMSNACPLGSKCCSIQT